MPFFKSLKFKLVFLAVIIQALVITFLIINSNQVSQTHLINQAQRHLANLKYSINASLGSAFIAKDYGTMKSVIDELTAQERITYIIIAVDEKILMSSKYDPTKPLPKLSQNFSTNQSTYHTFANIEFYGQVYATIYFGFDISFLKNASDDLLSKNILIGFSGLGFSIILLILVHSWMTKNISQLTQAAQEISHGNFNVTLQSTSKSNDEIGVLAKTFEHMIQTINTQIETITQNNKKFKTIADYTYSWENWFDNSGKLLWINPAVTRISGYTELEAYEMENFPFCIISDEYRENILDIHACALNGTSGHDVEFQIISKDGFPLWVAMSWQSIYDENHTALGYRSSIRDISTEHDITEKLSHKESINKLLEQRVQENLNNLRQKDLMLIQQSKMASMGEMIANIAHQWRQPLSAITSSASALKVNDELGILDQSTLHSYIHMIIKNCGYLSDTIENFRNFFNPNQAKSEIELIQLIDDVLAIFGTHFTKHHIVIEKDLNNVQLYTFVNGLQQVLLNFVKNAKDAIGEHGVIKISSKQIENHITICVQDSGGGIPEEIKDKIFDPYFTTKHKSQGTGIGLNMSYQIIKNHLQGDIIVCNDKFVYNEKEYFGASFEITIPLKANDEIRNS